MAQHPNTAKARQTLRLAMLAAVALLLAVVPLSGNIARWLGPPGDNWLANALASKGFIIAAAVTAACLLLVVALGTALWRAGAPGRQARSRGHSASQDGTAMIEFALVLPILLMLTLVLIQSSLVMGGNLCVHYSAYCAARSAIVIVPRPLAGEDANQVSPAADMGKMYRIKRAAVWALLPVSSDYSSATAGDAAVIQSGLRDFFNSYGYEAPGWAGVRMSRRLGYAEAHTQVELDPPQNGDTYAEHEDLQVKVTHDLYLSVPYGAALYSLVDGVSIGNGERATRVIAYSRLPNEGVQDWVEPERFAP
jgi:hypothetical protein